MIESSRSLAV